MCKYLLVGNPNVGKSTFFNRITASNEHTGNFHGVTVEAKSKTITFENKQMTFVDLPGLYSLNTCSPEEELSKAEILKKDATVLMIIDANSLRRNLYLSLQLLELNIPHKIFINNYDYFFSHKNSIDIERLRELWGTEIEIVNAKKVRLKELNLSVANVNCKLPYSLSLPIEQLIMARYAYIDQVLNQVLKQGKDFIYGYHKLDKIIINPFVMTIGFAFVFFASIYFIFFSLGPKISDLLSLALNKIFISPIMNFLYSSTDNVWLLEFFDVGVFGGISAILCFLPQVVLMFVFLTILEDSGLISRMSYVFDDFFTIFGLNGKAVYIMLLGLGCNTMSAVATRNLPSENLRTKTAIINPYVSCMARLPVFVLIASAIFSKNAYFVVAGLYLLGLIVAFLMSLILNKTILPTGDGELLLEFPPLKFIDFKHIIAVSKTNLVDFVKRVFSTVLCVSIIAYLLTHTGLNFAYTSEIDESIMFMFVDKIKFVFAPIGLNNAGLVCALIMGVFAKELMLSCFAVCNCVKESELMSSLLLSSSVVHFSPITAVCFLVFSLLYSPCASTLAVIKKENGKFAFWFVLLSQFTLAYILTFAIYQLLTNGIVAGCIILTVLALIVYAICKLVPKFKIKNKRCAGCFGCRK